MSTSLKVVSMAAVFCASFRRRAIVWRRRDIGTRSSRAAWSGGDGARTEIGAGDGTSVGLVTGCAAATASALVIRPSLPVPATTAGLTPRSVMIFCAAGDVPSGALAADLGLASSTSLAVAALRSGFVAAAGAAFAGAGLAPAPFASIVASTAPTLTTAPFLTLISERTPAAGAGTSSVTLSVSSSTSGSSAATVSPTFLNHEPTVASVTDSPRVGTRISVAMDDSLFRYSAKASSRKACSWATCFAMRPVAVAAAAARPA